MRRAPVLLLAAFACGSPDPGASGTATAGTSSGTTEAETSAGAETTSTSTSTSTGDATTSTSTSTSTTTGVDTTTTTTSGETTSTSTTSDTDAATDTDTSTGGDPLDDLLTLDHVQVKGTHNSYHVEPPIPFDASHEYSHAPLDVQLADQGVRAFELDVHEGLGGFEVYHISVIDSVSTCDAFTDCLEVIKGWSDDHPLHLPVAVWLEIKDSTGGLPIDAGDLDLIDDDIRAVFPEERLLTPDDIQGDYASVRAALEDGGWPTIASVRGQVLFVLLNTDDKSEDYTYGFTTTEGRAMFARVEPDQFAAPWAAIAKLGLSDDASITAAHAAQILIATNVCGAGEDDDACQADLETAMANGIHMLKDDFPAPIQGKTYWMDLVDGNPARCNPVTAPPECTSAALEDL
ncbi:MAG: hypothetical protein KC486_07440 [Myxococcales bacterium]|nr:hypothetical protein [Myxococcales bacterium]